MKIGFMTSTCPDYTVRQIVETCKTLGFQGFEPRIEWNHAHGIEPDGSPGFLEESRRIWEDAGLVVPCVASGIGTAVAGDDRREALEQIRRVVELNRRIGSPYIRVFGKGDKELDEETRIHLAIETLSEAADLVKGSGVTLLLETHDFFKAGRMVGRVVDAVGRPEVAVLWDTMHSVVAGETLEETAGFLKLDRVKHTHFRDLHLGEKKPNGLLDWTHCYDYGRGNFPLRRASEILKEAGYDGFASLEVIFKPGDKEHDPAAFLQSHAAGMKAVHQG